MHPFPHRIAHALVLLSFASATAAGEGVIVRETATAVEYTAQGPRPVAEAVKSLAKRGFPVTYEDPPFAYTGDLRDVTAESDPQNRRDPAVAKLLVPAAGSLTWSHPRALDRSSPKAVAVAVGGLVRAQNNRVEGGTFEVVADDTYAHVRPVRVRGRDGDAGTVQSVLDRRITIETKTRTADEMLAEFCKALTKEVGTRVSYMVSPNNMLQQSATRGARNEVAREVLVRTLTGTGHSLTWLLLYAPDTKEYGLNIMPVRTARVMPAPPPPPGRSAQDPTSPR